MIQIKNIKLYTVLEVAEALDRSLQAIRNYIKDGIIRAYRIGTVDLITDEEINSIATQLETSK
jgi:excisionase family DNA binding protein